MLVPKAMAAGYEICDVFFDDPKDRAAANEIHLERRRNDFVDFITFSFAKYGRSRFQVHFGKRQIANEARYRLKGNLVCRPEEYYHWWGKQWWMPSVGWSDKRAENTVKMAAKKLDYAFLFLDSGERNSAISRQIGS
jgi:hypothetical protein